MISEKAVEAAAAALDPGIWQQEHPGYTRAEVESFHFRRRKSAEEARAALSAALPVLLEEKRDDVYRIMTETLRIETIERGSIDIHRVVGISAAADRIISIMGGGE